MLNRLMLIVHAVLIGAVAYLFYFTFSQTPKIAYVDSSRLINQYQGMVDARSAYQQKAQQWQARVDTLGSELQQAVKDYEKESPRMTKKEKALSQELLRNKQQQLADYQRAIREQASQEDQKMTGEVLSQINAYLESYGKRNGYKVLFAATEAGNIVYAEEAMDVTNEVLEELNANYVK